MPALHSADQEQLQKLLLGQLSTAEVERLATEYADDGRLAELAESLAGKDDALLALLHNHETAVVDPDGERLVERLLERLKPALPAKPRDDTAAMRLADASTEPSSPDLMGKAQPLPERLEHYRPIKVLGQGGMGTVYLAEDTRLGREVAIKTLRAELAINPQFKQRFLREARTAAKLEHDNVIPIYSVGEAADGTPFLAMPLLKGEPLDALIRRTPGPLPVATVVRIAREAASGLAAAHAHGLIHRDIKPANIWLEAPTGRVKILDFGLAKAADAKDDADSETNLTNSGAIVGTPAFMAPEQASGDAVDGRADLFSLGCVLYELLAGKRAFSGPNTMSILMSLANHTPPAPDTLSPQCPAALSRLVMQLLEKDPAKRPASAEAVIQALSELEAAPAVVGWALLPVIPNATGKSAHPTNPVLPELATPSGSPIHVEHTQSNASRPSDSSLTLPSTAVFPVRKRAIPKQRVALALAGVLLMLLAAVVYRIKTDQGTLVVDIKDPEVQAILEQDGLVIHDKHSKRTWSIKAAETTLPSGEFQLKVSRRLLVTDDSGAELTTDSFTLKRKGEVRVQVTLEQNAKLAGKNGGANKPAVGAGWHGWPADAPPPAITPFDAEQAQQHQAAWAKYLGVKVDYTNTIGMKFVLIPPGEFTMGSTPAQIEEALKFVAENKHWQECIKSEAPQHKVILTQPIYLGVHEVTQAEYEKVMGNNPSIFGPMDVRVAGMDTSSFPVETVNWDDATDFCTKLSEKEKLEPFKSELRAGKSKTIAETGYRLPTEAEWEYACRAGTTTKYWNGDKVEDLVPAGWFQVNQNGRTHTKGELKANPFGLFDVYGNVWEWVQDWWNPNYYEQFQEKPATDPRGPASAGSADSWRVIRGGDWHDPASLCLSSSRHGFGQSARWNSNGFRVALTVDAVRQALKVTGPTMPKAGATTPARASDFAADRRAAEYVLSIGGAVTVRWNEQERWSKAIADLPREPFRLTHVELTNNQQLNDRGLANFKDCKHLIYLSLHSTAVSDAGMANFQNCKELMHVQLGSTPVSDVGLVYFQDCQNLIGLGLSGTKVTDKGLALFVNCKRLTDLDLNGTHVTDAGIANFKWCKDLISLNLNDTQVSDAGLIHLKNLKNLTSLVLSKTKVTAAGVDDLKKALPKCKIEWDGGAI